MRIVTVIWLSCLIAVAVVLPAKADDCPLCRILQLANPPYEHQVRPVPFGSAPAVVPQVPNGAALNRYLDAQNGINSEALSVHKYELGILDNPGAQQKIMIDNVFRDFRLNMQKR